MIVEQEGLRLTWVEKIGVEGKEEELKSDDVEEDRESEAGDRTI